MLRSNWPTFENSMEYSFDYINQKTDIDRWNILSERYDVIKNKPVENFKIPKIIHQIWLGESMPDFEKNLTQQVKNTLGSEWDYILWRDKDIYNLKEFKNINVFLNTPNKGQQSDILRYAILNEIGGIYLDTDFLLVKQFDEFLDLDFFCGVSYDSSPTVFNGLIGSTPNNLIIKDTLIHDREIKYHDAMELMDSTGPFFLERKIFKNINNCKDAVVLPNSFFYPLPNFDRSKKLGNNYMDYIKPETVCCHMWSSSWM